MTQWTLALLCALSMGVCAMEFEDIPAAAPDDAVMASPAELQDMAGWVLEAFTGKAPEAKPGIVTIDVRRQDFNVLRFGQSCMETPVRIGDQAFTHGLGTHANSELAVHLPPGAAQFKAFVGIDNNYDTGGTRGSVEFSVEIGGQEMFHSPTLRGGDQPCPVSIDIPEGTDLLILKVDTTPDGPGYDQSDWADAQLIMNDGTTLWLDEGHHDRLLLPAGPPFSFVYDGKPSREFLNAWTFDQQSTDTPDAVEHAVRWTDPATSLSVSATVRVFKRFAAADWVLRFENAGAQDTPLLEDVQALDVELGTGNSKTPALVRRSLGDHCGEQSFMLEDVSLDVGGNLRMAPVNGRSSNGAFPFFDVRYGAETLTTAVGWSGQWAASVDRSQAGPTRLRAGMELTHLVLHPGEAIRTPRILLLLGSNDLDRVHNQFRRLLLFHFVPKLDGKPARLPIALQCFDRYSWTRPEWATEAGQINAIEKAHEMGFDSYWFDAAWFVGGFPNGVGNWYPKPDAFPNGLKPLGDACHRYGMKFILWFEPERVAKGTQIAQEHPDFVFGGAEGGLFKLNDPEARRWLTDLLSNAISEAGLDFYRNDFNIDPLGFWRANDAPDRQGMTEIRYIEGLYEMWDELRARHPGLLIDNCASGGRRIDLEMCMRSVPLWRSDTNCSPSHNDWNQAQTFGMNPYLPFHTACAWTTQVYEVRSAATAGLLCQWGYLDEGFSIEQAQAMLVETKADQKFWYGDFYPLTAQSTATDAWAAYQMHRADLDAGVVIVFRRETSNYTGLAVQLKGLTAGKTYALDILDDAGGVETRQVSAEELMAGFELRLAKKGSSQLVRYRAEQ